MSPSWTLFMMQSQHRLSLFGLSCSGLKQSASNILKTYKLKNIVPASGPSCNRFAVAFNQSQPIAPA